MHVLPTGFGICRGRSVGAFCRKGDYMKRGVIIAVALVMLMTPGVLLAQGACMQKIIRGETVGLDMEQLARIEAIGLEHRMATQILEAELEILQLKMDKMLMKDNPSERKLERLVSKISTVRKKIEKHRLEQMLEMRKALGPGQWKQLAQFGGMGDCRVMMMKGEGSGGRDMSNCRVMMMKGEGSGSGDMSNCRMMMMKGEGSGGRGMGGNCSMRMMHGGNNCCAMGAGCCAGAGHCCMGQRSSMHKECPCTCCGQAMGGCRIGHGSCCGAGVHRMQGSCCMGGMHDMSGCRMGGSQGTTGFGCMHGAKSMQKPSCPGGMEKMKEFAPEKKIEKKIQRRWIKK